MGRNSNVFIVAAVLAAFSVPAYADSDSGIAAVVHNISARLNIYRQVIDAIEAAGDAIAHFTIGIKQAVATGSDLYDVVSAERELTRLKNISERATYLGSVSQQKVVRSIDEYLRKSSPTRQDWQTVKDGIQYVVNDVRFLLDDVRKERGDLVLEDAYQKLVTTLNTRTEVLNSLSELPPPTSKAEFDAVSQINKKYKRLLVEFRESIKHLNLYIKQKQLPA